MKKFLKSKLIKFIKKNPLPTAFLLISILVVLVGAIKSSSQKSKYIYTKLKLSQGYWWVNSQKPSIWQVNAFKDQNLSKKGDERIEDVMIYPRKQGDYDSTNEKFDMYVIAKLLVKQESNNKLSRNREGVSIGSPIELSLPLSDITATVIDISDKPYNSEYEERIVELVGIEQYRLNEYQLYESINIGDKYHNGSEIVFEILDKHLEPIVNEVNYSSGITRQIKSSNIKNIILTTKMQLQNKNGRLIYGEEQVVVTGGKLDIYTQNTDLSTFYIGKITDLQ